MLDLLAGWRSHGIVAGFTGRAGGRSKPPYDSLNIGMHVGDDHADVLANRRQLAATCGVRLQHFVYASQVHGNTVVRVGKEHAGRGAFSHEDALVGTDAMVTDVPGVALVALAADCVPVLFADFAARVVGVAHAGWRGATGGVVPSAVAAMEELGARAADLHVALGPAIRGCCYEVDAPVIAAVREAYRQFAPGIPVPKVASFRAENHYMLDLPMLIRAELAALGVRGDRIDDIGVCTHCDERYFSHRRDHGRTGRQGGLILIEQDGIGNE